MTLLDYLAKEGYTESPGELSDENRAPPQLERSDGYYIINTSPLRMDNCEENCSPITLIL